LPETRRKLHLAQNLRDLSLRHIGLRAAASGRLEESPPTEAELVDLLADPDPYVRAGAAQWTRHLEGEPSAALVHAIRSAIHDPNPHIAHNALGSVALLRLTAAREDVRMSLDDGDANVAHAAIFALGKIGPAEEGAHLLRFLQRREQHLVVGAVTALGELRYAPAAPVLLAKLEQCRGIDRQGQGQRAFLLPQRCINALVALQVREAIPLLIRIVEDETGLRRMAVQGLIGLRAREAAPALLPLLKRLLDGDGIDEKLCCNLLLLMTAVDYRFAQRDVRGWLYHRMSGVRCAALRATALWHDGEAVALVQNMAHHDPSAFVRPVAVSALAELLGIVALADLETLAGDPNSLVRGAVAEALGMIAGLPPEGRHLLVRLALDSAGPVVRAAREALRRIPDAPAAPLVEEAPPLPLLPPALREQASAARAFLHCWQTDLPALPVPQRGELESALRTLLRALS
jgi:HEAT repeat protein